MRNRIFVYALCLALLNLASPQAAQAALVGTLQAVEASGTRAQDLAIVNSALAREQVRGQMAAMGVDPSAVDARVARLTDSELRSLRTPSCARWPIAWNRCRQAAMPLRSSASSS